LRPLASAQSAYTSVLRRRGYWPGPTDAVALEARLRCGMRHVECSAGLSSIASTGSSFRHLPFVPRVSGQPTWFRLISPRLFFTVGTMARAARRARALLPRNRSMPCAIRIRPRPNVALVRGSGRAPRGGPQDQGVVRGRSAHKGRRRRTAGGINVVQIRRGTNRNVVRPTSRGAEDLRTNCFLPSS